MKKPKTVTVSAKNRSDAVRGLIEALDAMQVGDQPVVVVASVVEHERTWADVAKEAWPILETAPAGASLSELAELLQINRVRTVRSMPNWNRCGVSRLLAFMGLK